MNWGDFLAGVLVGQAVAVMVGVVLFAIGQWRGRRESRRIRRLIERNADFCDGHGASLSDPPNTAAGQPASRPASVHTAAESDCGAHQDRRDGSSHKPRWRGISGGSQ